MVAESRYQMIDMLYHFTMGLTKMWSRFRNEVSLDDELDLMDKRDTINLKLETLHKKMMETPNPFEWTKPTTDGLFTDIIGLQQDIYRYQESTSAHQKMSLTNKMTLGFSCR